jgi:hypothetical protein
MRYRAVSWSLAGLTALVLATALTLLSLDARWIDAGKLGFEAVLAVLAVVLYAGTGHLLMVRRPGNAIGLLLALVGLLLALEMLTEQYPLYGLVTAPGSLPAARLVGWFSVLVAVLAVFLLLFLVLLFPDGRLPSRRWRPVRTGFLVVMAASVVSQMQAGQYISGGLTDILDDSHASYPNPLGIFPQHGWFAGFVAAVAIATFAAALCAVASVFVRRRGASPERRKQLAWLGYVGIVTAFWILLLAPGAAIDPGAHDSLGTVLWVVMILTPVVGIPVACVVAVLKYRLYDIDRLISRTVSYAIVTGLLVGMYAGLVLLSGAVLPRHDSVTVAGSTLVAAALFNPVRRRVQHRVDRRFNRSRYDAELMTAAFAARLQDATDLDAARADLTVTVDRALQPAHLSLWLTS